MRNILKEKLARGEKPLGTFVGTGSAAVVECLGCAGLDFAILDNEHSPIEAETTARLVCAAERRNITPLARVREISRPAILKLLDVGVQGIIIPDVHSAAEVKRVVDYAKYAPVGQRGFCPSRKDGWGTDTPAGVLETMAHFNGETLVIPQCETTEALADIENIAAMEGVDGIFIGPFDLSISMGLPGAFEEQRVRAKCRDRRGQIVPGVLIMEGDAGVSMRAAALGDHVVQLFFHFFSKVEIHSISHHDYMRRMYIPPTPDKDYGCKICFDWRNFIYESNRHRAPHRRPGPCGHP